jgi:hypothetical protein
VVANNYSVAVVGRPLFKYAIPLLEDYYNERRMTDWLKNWTSASRPSNLNVQYSELCFIYKYFEKKNYQIVGG